MANWASTSYRIEGSESDLKKVYNVIDNFVSGKSKPVLEDASTEWEGNIVKALGASDEQLKRSYLRGFIENLCQNSPFTISLRKLGVTCAQQMTLMVNTFQSDT